MSKIFRYSFLILGALIILIPFYICLVTSFKTEIELGNSLPYALPQTLYLDNYILVLKNGEIFRGFANISYIALLAVSGNVLFGAMAAYAIARFKFVLKPIIVGAFAAAIIIPGITTQVATFGVIKALGLFNTPYAMVILSLGANIIQLQINLQFIKNIPYDLDESAMLDGASLFSIFRLIILPLMKPAIVTNAILSFIGIYNEIYTPFLYMPSPKNAVVSTFLMRFSNGISTDWTKICAAAILVCIPSVIIYLLLQRYIFSGIMSGAVKG